MDTKTLERYFEPPPRFAAVAEALPHLGGLALRPYAGALPDEVELHAAEPLPDAFEDGHAREILKKAQSLPRVRERLARGRVAVIGVSRLGEVAKGERRTFLVVGYDYSQNLAVEIALDERGELLALEDTQYQPAPADFEIERAVALARADQRLAPRLEGLVAMAIPYAGLDNEYANRRVIEVLFGCRAERLPRFRAWVDLGLESVLHVGAGCGCGCGGHGEEAAS